MKCTKPWEEGQADSHLILRGEPTSTHTRVSQQTSDSIEPRGIWQRTATVVANPIARLRWHQPHFCCITWSRWLHRLLWQRGPGTPAPLSISHVAKLYLCSIKVCITEDPRKWVTRLLGDSDTSEGTCISSLARFHSHPRGLTHNVLGLSRRQQRSEAWCHSGPWSRQGTFSTTHHSQGGSHWSGGVT